MDANKYTLLLALALGLAGCGKSERVAEPAPSAPPAAAPQLSAADIAAAVANSNRPAADREEDSWRKPAEVLQFLEVRPGAHVIDYFSAAGYFTELLSYAVGPQGKVVAYNNDSYFKFAGDKIQQRYGNERLPNVAQVTAPPETVELEPQSLDAALFVLSYHDLYWRSTDGSWPTTDPARSLQQLVPALKPGAAVVVVDHAAVAGTDPWQTVDALHRIDPDVVKRDFIAAGLELEAESPMLQNPADDRTKKVFDPSVRYKTDRVVYRFRKR